MISSSLCAGALGGRLRNLELGRQTRRSVVQYIARLENYRFVMLDRMSHLWQKRRDWAVYLILLGECEQTLQRMIYGISCSLKQM